ncbi:MAG: hypothetical protein ACI8TQ_002459, partial [Planctomycetota bacterium]
DFALAQFRRWVAADCLTPYLPFGGGLVPDSVSDLRASHRFYCSSSPE